MKANRQALAILGLLAFVLVASFTSWAATSGGSRVAITAVSGNGVTDGRIALVTNLGGSVTGLVGNKAQKQVGVALQKITLASSSLSHKLVVNFLLTSPDSLGQALNNPNALIKAQLYWLDTDQTEEGTSSECSADRLSIADAGTRYVCPDTGGEASKYTSKVTASADLRSSKAGQSVFYLLAEITVPGGVPQGQQSQLGTLAFWTKVKKR